MCYGSREFQQLKQMNKTLENNLMDQDIFAGQWQQMRGTLKVWWGKLTDSDFERVGGQTDKLIGVLQEKYGYVRAQVQQEVERQGQDRRNSAYNQCLYPMEFAKLWGAESRAGDESIPR